MNIVHDKHTKEYFMYVSVPIDFYLQDDKRIENQNSLKSKQIVSLDPGVRTFLMCYSNENSFSIGDNASEEIYRLQLHLDKLNKPEDLKEQLMTRKRIKNLVEDLHWKVIKFLTSNFNTIIYPDFTPTGMLKGKSLHSSVKRKMLALSFFKFKQRLIYKCKSNKNVLIITNESYTSRTCTNCGHLNNKSTDKTFRCESCRYEIDRDINGARNILIKTCSMLFPIQEEKKYHKWLSKTKAESKA